MATTKQRKKKIFFKEVSLDILMQVIGEDENVPVSKGFWDKILAPRMADAVLRSESNEASEVLKNINFSAAPIQDQIQDKNQEENKEKRYASAVVSSEEL